jgi:hypothetical protein
VDRNVALSQRERTLLGATVTVLFVAAQYLLAAPFARTWRQLGNELFAEQRELSAHQAHIARGPQWQAEYDQLRAQVGQKITQFVEMSDVLKKIEEVGAGAGVIITGRKPLPENDRGVYREFHRP